MASSFSHGIHLLIFDTCAERASVALFAGDQLVAEMVLEERTASAALLTAVRDLLHAAEVRLDQLGGVGVVSGPGSFTGVRVGIAMAKGLCEAAGLPVAAVSRLVVLGRAAGLRHGFALLEAGRGQVYGLRFGPGQREPEFMAAWEDFENSLESVEVAVTSVRLAEQARVTAADVRLVELSARDALGAVRDCIALGGSDLATLDGNYLRAEDAIYARKMTRDVHERLGPSLA